MAPETPHQSILEFVTAVQSATQRPRRTQDHFWRKAGIALAFAFVVAVLIFVVATGLDR
jgi:hypothetical protein